MSAAIRLHNNHKEGGPEPPFFIFANERKNEISTSWVWDVTEQVQKHTDAVLAPHKEIAMTKDQLFDIVEAYLKSTHVTPTESLVMITLIDYDYLSLDQLVKELITRSRLQLDRASYSLMKKGLLWRMSTAGTKVFKLNPDAIKRETARLIAEKEYLESR